MNIDQNKTLLVRDAGGTIPRDIAVVVERYLTSAAKDPDACGISPERVAGLPSDLNGMITYEASAGVSPDVVELVLEFSPVIASIVQDIWDEFIFPWLKDNFGRDRISER